MKDGTAISEERRTMTVLRPVTADELEMLVQGGHRQPHACWGRTSTRAR